MSYFKTLASERLFMREISIDDAEEIFRLRANDSVNEMIDRQKALSIDDAIEFIQKILNLSKNNEVVMWVITLAGGAKLAGTVVYWHIEWENNKAEIGYELLPEYQGKGIMTEALKKIIDFGFAELGFKTINADPKAINVRSVKLLEKLGFKQKGETGDEYLVFELNKDF